MIFKNPSIRTGDTGAEGVSLIDEGDTKIPGISEHKVPPVEAPHDRPGNSPMELLLRPVRILIVDDEAIVRDILARKLSTLGYYCDCCENSQIALSRLEKINYDLMLADIMMSELGSIKLLEEALNIRPEIAIILVTSVVDIELAVDLLKEGAYDYITKPFSLEEVSISVSRALEKRQLLVDNKMYQRSLEEQVSSRTRQLKEALEVLHHTYHSTLMALGTALDTRDADADGHSLRVTIYATRLARQLSLDPDALRVIQQGAVLHDIGKIGVPDSLLRKSEKLTEDEWVLMRKHPEIGFRILSGIKFLKDAAQLVLQHQERYDGQGYPSHLKGEAIFLGARIFAVADTLDCITSHRPFQPATGFEAAQEEIIRVSGTQLDPAVVDAFLKIPLSEWKQVRHEVSSRVNLNRYGRNRLPEFYNAENLELGIYERES
jgi:putative nucleotidyltransferase with HDIG domain